MNSRSLSVIDKVTGELVEDGSVSIRHKSQDDGYRRMKERKGRGRSFFWNGLERMPIVSEALTPSQSGYLLVLSSYINYDGLLVRSENDPTAMDTSDMQKVLRLTGSRQSTFYDFLAACLINGVIVEKETDHFYVTKPFHFKGKTEGERVAKTYITALRAMYEEVSAHNIGLLYRMIPYIHIESNVLCVNPEEVTPSLVRKMSRKELAEAIGVNPATVSRITGRLIYDNKPVFAVIRTATDGTYYMLNPSIFERKEREYNVTERTIFGLDS